MNNIEKAFFYELTEKMNFFIKEYKDEDGCFNRWIALYELEEVFIGVIVSKEDTYINDFKDAKSYMKLNLNKELILFKVIESEKMNITLEDIDDNTLIYSKPLKKFVFKGSRTNIFEGVINNLEHEKIKKRKKLEIKKYIITYILILINVIIYILEAYFSGNIFNIDVYTLVYMGAKFNPLIESGEVFRFITAGFLHGGIVHLTFNMLALKSIGKDLEYYLGKIKYTILYFISLLGGSIFSYVFSDSISVGASGAIFGLLGSTLVFAIKNRDKIDKRYIRNIIETIIFNVIIGISISNIDNYGHFGGLIFGIIISFILIKKYKKI